eukprot:1735759-Prymnesium_polylepis.1
MLPGGRVPRAGALHEARRGLPSCPHAAGVPAAAATAALGVRGAHVDVRVGGGVGEAGAAAARRVGGAAARCAVAAGGGDHQLLRRPAQS